MRLHSSEEGKMKKLIVTIFHFNPNFVELFPQKQEFNKVFKIFLDFFQLKGNFLGSS